MKVEEKLTLSESDSHGFRSLVISALKENSNIIKDDKAYKRFMDEANNYANRLATEAFDIGRKLGANE